MMRYILTLAGLCLALASAAQKTHISGTVKDANSGEALISANFLYAEGKGVVTDLDGRFSVEVPNGEYEVKVSYIGYETETRKVNANGGALNLEFALKTVTLNEVQVVADMAIDRKTPVAFTNVDPIKLKQELAGQDLPMILNSTPGVYATQQGGGAGDARVTIRGFSQRNVSVQIDGVPMNDMEDGQVYWSNWAGIEGVTQRVQVQRGLGASKLSIPAVGGSMNILTNGITSKMSTEIELGTGNNGLFKTSIAHNTGRLKGNWGLTFALAFDRQDGYVEQTYANRMFYFIKIQKQFGNHTLSIGAMGAPQKRGRRNFQEAIHIYDRAYAEELGVDLNDPSVLSELPGNYGIRYNRQWGVLSRNRNDPNARPEDFSTSENFYHKPILNIKHFWSKDKWAVSNIFYGSFGNGGSTQLRGNTAEYDQYGHFDLTKLYNDNVLGTPFAPPVDMDAVPDSNQIKARNYVLANINNHYWYGLLSTIDHRINDAWKLAVGLDFRSFWVEHYSTPYDLLGGDYAVIPPTASDLFFYSNKAKDNVKRLGDISGYRTNTTVYTVGIFGQVEYSKNRFSGFVSVSAGYNSYIRSDQMRKRDLVLPDTIMELALDYNDTITYNGQQYSHQSPEARIATSDWTHYWGGTAKMGVNYNITRHMNVFFNGGVFFRPPTISDVYAGNTFTVVEGIGTEVAWGVELGYSVKYPRWAANLNLYRTTWENRPEKISVSIGGTPTLVALPNLGSVHQGVELDAVYKTPWFFDIEGLFSFGDWRWKGTAIAYSYEEGSDLPSDADTVAADGVHIGDAAQFQVGGSISVKPVDGVYLKGQITYFDNNYASFSPLDLQGANSNRDSWRLPSYYLLDLHAGWTIKLKKMDVMIRASVLNVLDRMYITDASNNAVSSMQNFDAASAKVYMGMGRRWTAGIGLKF